MRPLLLLLLVLGGCAADKPAVDLAPPASPTASTGSTEPEPAVSLELQDRPDVDDALATAAEDAGLSGAVAGVGRRGRVVYLGGWGWAERDVTPMDPQKSMIRWASLSKGLTGTAAVQAQLRGELSLDDQAADTVAEYETPTTYRPEGCEAVDCALPLESPSVTIADLLQNAGAAPHYDSGLTDPVPPTALRNDPAFNTGIAWALPLWVDQPAINVPGTTYHYSTMGFNLAGVAVEGAAGRPLAELVAEHIASPLGMTTLQPDLWWTDIPHRAVGYDLVDGVLVEGSDTDVSWKLPGGGFISTGEDLTRWCAGLLTPTLMPLEVRDDILWTPTGPSSSYALGFGVSGAPGDRVIDHGGSQEKAKTALLIYPDEGLCFTVMSNATHADPWALVAALEEAWRS